MERKQESSAIVPPGVSHRRPEPYRPPAFATRSSGVSPEHLAAQARRLSYAKNATLGAGLGWHFTWALGAPRFLDTTATVGPVWIPPLPRGKLGSGAENSKMDGHPKTPFNDPTVMAAIAADLDPNDIQLMRCLSCGLLSYYDDGSVFRCRWCGFDGQGPILDNLADNELLISLADYLKMEGEGLTPAEQKRIEELKPASLACFKERLQRLKASWNRG